MIKTCEEYVMNEFVRTKEELFEAQQKNVELHERYKKAFKIIEIIKKNAKVQFNSVWVHIFDEDERDFIVNALELKEEEKPNE